MKNFKIVLTTMLLVFFTVGISVAQKKNYKSKPKTTNAKPKAFHIHQHVMVTMKDGSQVEGVVHSHFSKKKYWVRQWHSGREGAVKEKYIRALNESEVSELKKSKKK